MRGFIVLFSDASGWTSIGHLAASLAREGALVVGVDLPSYFGG